MSTYVINTPGFPDDYDPPSASLTPPEPPSGPWTDEMTAELDRRTDTTGGE